MVYLKENYKKILPYAGIFFVLFMGSGLVKIPVGSVWFYVIKFGIIAAVLGIGVSAWWKSKKNNEPPTDYLKLALFVPFTIDFHLHYAFIVLTIILFNKKLLLPWNSPLKPIYLLFIWGFISYVINQFVEFNPLSFPLFTVTFFLPFIFFSLFFQFANSANNVKIHDFFNTIVLMVMALVGIQIISFGDAHPDIRNGGTLGSHYAALFISFALLLILFKYDSIDSFRANFKYRESAILLISLPIMFLLDAKYVLMFLFVVVPITFFIYRLQKLRTKIIAGISFVVLLSVWILLSNGVMPISTLVVNDANYNIINLSKQFLDSPKARIIESGLKLPQTEPLAFFFGSGPGTFLSRASNARVPVEQGKSAVTYGHSISKSHSKLPSFISEFESSIRKKYGKEYYIDVPWQGSFFDWRSSFINVYFEFGVIGIVLFIFYFIYQNLYSKKNRDILATVFSLTIFMLLLSFFELWYEQAAFQVCAYGITGLTLNKS